MVPQLSVKQSESPGSVVFRQVWSQAARKVFVRQS